MEKEDYIIYPLSIILWLILVIIFPIEHNNHPLVIIGILIVLALYWALAHITIWLIMFIPVNLAYKLQTELVK